MSYERRIALRVERKQLQERLRVVESEIGNYDKVYGWACRTCAHYGKQHIVREAIPQDRWPSSDAQKEMDAHNRSHKLTPRMEEWNTNWEIL